MVVLGMGTRQVACSIMNGYSPSAQLSYCKSIGEIIDPDDVTNGMAIFQEMKSFELFLMLCSPLHESLLDTHLTESHLCTVNYDT